MPETIMAVLTRLNVSKLVPTKTIEIIVTNSGAIPRAKKGVNLA